MSSYQINSNAENLLNMYKMVWQHGVESEARGQKTKNIHNFLIVFDASKCPLTSFEDRKLNLDYCKQEWIWYLGANRYDDSIEQHAKMWKKLKQDDGSFYSNYGHYIFGPSPNLTDKSQFEYCFEQLCNDRGTRRASMVLLNQTHLYHENTDTVCTYAINFTIELGHLHMTVMMRSNDVIYGFTNDAFCFHQLYTFMYAKLKEVLPDLKHGYYTHFANSMHVYERHYDMIDKIVLYGMSRYQPVTIPEMYAGEADNLLITKGKFGLPGRDYSDWLLNVRG